MAATPLGTLLGDSWGTFRRAFVPLLIGAIVFGLILGVGQSFVGKRVTERTGSFFQELGITQQQIEDLQRRIQEGDQAAMDELAQKMQGIGGAQGEAFVQKMVQMYTGLLPVLGASIVIIWLISLIASAYFLVLALDERLAFGAGLARTPALIIPLFLLSLWVFIRTFVWIPFIGIITGIILGPRFVAAPVLLVKERKGVLESASLSYARTSGYWGKIFGNLIVAGLCAWVALVVLTFVAGFLGVKTAALLTPILSMLATAFLTIFMVKLSLTVLANPRRA